MVFSELALGYITNLMYDFSKKIPSKFSDTYSKIYDIAIERLSNKYPNFDKTNIDLFLGQEKVETTIKQYLKNPNKLDYSNILRQMFFELFDKKYFTQEDSTSILNSFFEIIDVEIEKDPELRDYLILYIAKQTNLSVQETNQVSKNTLEVAQEISQNIKEIRRVINDGRVNINKRRLDTDFEESINAYLKRIIAENNEIGINEVYTELSAAEILPATLKFFDENEHKEEEFEVLELVKKEEKFIISGESGSGKTTTLKWLNVIYATNCLEKREEIIPLYLELNSYTKGSVYDYIRIRTKGKGISEDNLKILLKGKAIILLDGLDLLSPTENFFPYDEITLFISEYSDCRFVISSRPGFFESIKNDFKVSRLKQLTDEKIITFIDKYVSDKKIGDIIKDKILNNKQLKSLLTNPMLLYLTIKIAKKSMERKERVEDLLPSNRSEIYEAFISGHFTHFEEKRGKSLHADRTQIENALIDLYFELQLKNKISCKYKEALQIVKKHADNDTFRKTTSQDILEDSIKIGLLTKKDSEIEYGIHQSFQEYFAAIKLKERFEKGFDVSEVFSHPKWEEVIIFTSEMLDLDFIDEFVDSLISKGELFLASKCVCKASNEMKEKLCALLADKLNSEFILDKKNSIQSLGKLGDIGIDLLTEVLDDEDIEVSREAVEALGCINSEKAIELLINTFNNEISKVRGEVAETLGEIKVIKAVESLIKALNAEPYVRFRVISALGQMKCIKTVELLIESLESDEAEVRSGAACALGEIKSEVALEPLINILQDEDFDVRDAVTYALEQMKSDKVIERLTKALGDQNPKVRAGVAETLAELKLEEVPEMLAIVIKDPESKVSRAAARAIGQIKSEKAVDLLINALSDIDSEVRGEIVSALGQTMSQRAVEPLISILSEKDSELQNKAASSLKQFKSEKTVELLIDALNDNDYRVRELAVDILGSMKYRQAIGPLTKALGDADPRVQKQAENSLNKINSHEEGVESIIKSIIESLNDEKFKLRWYQIEKMEHIKSEEAVDPLIKALKHIKSDVRFVVARSLGQIKSKKAVGPLIETLSDKERWVRIYTAHALGNIKSEKAVEPLIKTLYDEDYSVRLAAAGALRNCCNLQNKNQLDELLKSDHIFVRNTAFEIIYEIEKEDRSKIILFDKQPPYRLSVIDNQRNDSEKKHVRPAEEGLKDAYFGGFVDRLKSATEPITIVDYGCGEGKFLSAMTTLPAAALQNISYIGVDISTRCRYISRLTAKKHGLNKKFRNEPEFLKPAAFSKKDVIADYIFFMHVLHEIRLIHLADIIYSLSSNVKNWGKIFILDQKELVEEERSFVLWDDEKDFEMLFKDSGFKSFVRYFTTGSGKQLSSIEIEKVEDKCFTKEDAGKNCLAVYKAKQAKLIEKRKQSGLSDEEYSEISVQLANIVEQIDEYERTI